MSRTMVKYVWAILALACALTQADDATGEIRNQYEIHARAINGAAEPLASASSKRAADASCHPSFMNAITLISDETLHDWENCVRISEVVLNVGWVMYNFTKEMGTAENAICDCIRNLTHCNQTVSYEKIECITGAIETTTVFLVTKTNGVMYWLEKLNEALENAVSTIVHCFGLTGLKFFENVVALMNNTKCLEPIKSG